jgi:hypothetical protein
MSILSGSVTYRIFATVSVFRYPFACYREAKPLYNVHWQDRSHRAGIDEAHHLIGAHLLRGGLPAAH